MTKEDGRIGALFLDVGGVLLTNGWDHLSRRRAAERFGLDFSELEDRHRLIFDSYELGRATLDQYLDRVVFDRPRAFTRARFKAFMLAQSRPLPRMRELMARLKARHRLKVAVVSNEGRELTEYRLARFGLAKFVDVFAFSCFVGIRKPDAGIFRLALDLVQLPPQRVVYIENTPMFVRAAKDLGIRAILHTDYASTHAKLAAFGLS